MTSASRGGATHESYARGAREPALRGQTIGAMLDAIVVAHGDRDAVVSVQQSIRWSYSDLAREVSRCAQALAVAGVAKGDRVGIWAPNCAEWLVVQFASAQIGSILVNLNPSYRAAELEYALRQSGCRLLVLAAGYRGADYVATLAGIEAPGLRETVVLGRGWDEFLARGDQRQAALPAEADLSFDDPINIQYTSGTTGFPKGATLTHHNILNNGFFIGETLDYTTADRVCIPVPFYHCFGMVLGTLAAVTHGACIVLLWERLRRPRDARGGRRRALHLALRGPDDVHRRARPAGLLAVRPVVAAHRDHGRLDVPGRGDEARPA